MPQTPLGAVPFRSAPDDVTPHEPSVDDPSSPATTNQRSRLESAEGLGVAAYVALPEVPTAHTPPATVKLERPLPYP